MKLLKRFGILIAGILVGGLLSFLFNIVVLATFTILSLPYITYPIIAVVLIIIGGYIISKVCDILQYENRKYRLKYRIWKGERKWWK